MGVQSRVGIETAAASQRSVHIYLVVGVGGRVRGKCADLPAERTDSGVTWTGVVLLS